MDKRSVIEFFDRLAPGWDADMVRSDEVIRIILDHAGVTEGKNILDVACGTGVLIQDYLKRNVASVTGIDISPKMVEIARNKFMRDNVMIQCADVEEMDFDRQFDCIVIYNAFPHFPEPERLIRKLSLRLAFGGTLTVAHGMSREKINAHHSGTVGSVSMELMEAEKLAGIFGKYLEVTTVLSDERMFLVVGRKRTAESAAQGSDGAVAAVFPSADMLPVGFVAGGGAGDAIFFSAAY